MTLLRPMRSIKRYTYTLSSTSSASTIGRQRQRRSPSSQRLYSILMSLLFYRHSALEHHLLCCHWDEPSFIVCAGAVLFRFAKIRMQYGWGKNPSPKEATPWPGCILGTRWSRWGGQHTISLLLWASSQIVSQQRKRNWKRGGNWRATCACLRQLYAIKLALVDKLTNVRTKRTSREIALTHTHTSPHEARAHEAWLGQCIK